MKILITGASGFIGSHMVDRALQLDHEVWASVRATSNRRYLTDERIHFVELRLDDADLLAQQLSNAPQWEIIIHCAGVTKCLHEQDYYTINYEATCHLVDTLIKLNKIPHQFIYMSTLGTYGPLHEKPPYRPITDADIPHPNTHYGRSKRMAEEYLMNLKGFPYVIFRPTGVYGPRDRDYRLFIDSIRHHVELTLGPMRQDITFVYIRDLVKAVFLAIRYGTTRKCYFITDGNVYTARDFGDMVRQALGNPYVIHLMIPLWLGRVVASLCDVIGHIIGRSLTLNSDKYRILSQRNWTCDIAPLTSELGYMPEYDLRRGIAETIHEPQE